MKWKNVPKKKVLITFLYHIKFNVQLRLSKGIKISNTAQKINRRLCEIYFIGSHKNQMRQFRYKPQKYFLATNFLLFKFISQQKKLR